MLRLPAFLLFALSAPASAEVTIAAHRGIFAPGVPENSLAAISGAVARNIAVVEVDLRKTADGEIVLMHDATVGRTTGASGRVARMTLARLKTLDVGGGRIPTYAEALALVRGTGTRLLLDIKSGGGVRPEEVVETARRAGALDRIVIGTRSAAEARAYRRLATDLPILGFVPRIADIDAFAAAGANLIRLWPKWLSAPASGCASGASPSCIVARLQRRGLAVWALADGLADAEASRAMFRRLHSLALDGILTNRPDLAAHPEQQ